MSPYICNLGCIRPYYGDQVGLELRDLACLCFLELALRHVPPCLAIFFVVSSLPRSCYLLDSVQDMNQKIMIRYSEVTETHRLICIANALQCFWLTPCKWTVLRQQFIGKRRYLIIPHTISCKWLAFLPLRFCLFLSLPLKISFHSLSCSFHRNGIHYPQQHLAGNFSLLLIHLQPSQVWRMLLKCHAPSSVNSNRIKKYFCEYLQCAF